MAAPAKPLTERAAWKALGAHYTKTRDLHLRKLFADDPKRGERLTTEAVASVIKENDLGTLLGTALKLTLPKPEKADLEKRGERYEGERNLDIAEDVQAGLPRRELHIPSPRRRDRSDREACRRSTSGGMSWRCAGTLLARSPD